MTTPKNILIGFLLALLLVLAIGVYSFVYFRSTVRLGRQGAVLNELVLMAKEAKAMLSDLERNVLAYQVAENQTFKDHFVTRSIYLTQQLDKLRSVAAPYPSFQSTIDAVKDSVTSYIKERLYLLEQPDGGTANISDKTLKGEAMLNNAVMMLGSLEEQATVAESLREEALTRQFYRFVFVFGGLLILAVTAIVGLLFASNAVMKTRALSSEKLRRTNETINELYENAPCGYLTVNQEGMITACNQTILSMLGYQKQEVEDRMHISRILPLWEELKQKHVGKNDPEAPTQAMEPEMIKKNGGRLIALASIAAVAEVDGDHYRLTLVDYTERKKYRDQLLQNNEDLEAFSYSVSHDLRAPLRAVNSYSSMLQEDFGASLSADAKQLLETIVRNAKNMTSMIEDLLRLSRMGQQEVIESDINMDSMVQNVIKANSERETTRATILVDPLGMSKGDIGLLKQVWVNLISNAIKYSAMADSPRIEIGVRSDGDERIFYVKDNGAGFDMQYYDKLFGVFQRLHSKKEFEGTGVGLSIVKRIVEKHQGRIWATSVVGEGATFYFTFKGA
jgi:PAS domain S-box-containing protein